MQVERNFFQRIPFIRIFSLFLIGILLNHNLTVDLRSIGIVFALLITVLLSFWYNRNFRVVQIQNFLISAAIVIAGFFYPAKVQNRTLPHFLRKDYYLAEVCQKPAEKAKTFQTILTIRNKSLAQPERLIAYFSKNQFDSTITSGDQLVLLAKPQQIRNLGNPYEFDYQSVLAKRDIRFSVYLSEGTYLKTDVKSRRLVNKAEQLRDKLISILSLALTEKEERSVVSALTLGYRAEIDQDTIDYFASTGAMHVLSVSGLHVALIYVILGFLLSFIKRGKTGNLIFSVVMISFLWIYAFITGFSPSVQRATVMFTFVIIGNGMRRQVNIYNSLASSAFLLILLSPNVIFDVGFQLSYLAVFGIVLIQPTLDGLLEITNPILKWCWSLFTVSIAAQLTTFPLGLFYFNQFPNLFWLSGFIVIPVTTLIIWLTLAFYTLIPFHGVAMFIGGLIQTITHYMLYSLKLIDALPLAVSMGIVLTPFQVFLLFSCIAVLVIFEIKKKSIWLFATLSLILIFQITEILEKRQLFNQQVIYVYNSKNLMIHLINGRTNYLITSNCKNLSRAEILAYEKVCAHLKLNQTQIISTDQLKASTFPDLFVQNNRIQFINSVIKLNATNSFVKNTDVIDFSVYPADPNSKVLTKRIYRGNRSTEEDSFHVKQEGAFYANLRGR